MYNNRSIIHIIYILLTGKDIDIRYLNVVWKLNSTPDLDKMYCMIIYQYPFPIEIVML